MHLALAHVCFTCEATGCGRRRWRNPEAPGSSRKAHRARQAQGRSLPWAAEGGGGSASAECHGLAVLPQYREAESTGYFAPQIPSLVGSSSGQDRIRVVATRRKTRTGSDHAAAFVGNHRSRARDQETERSRGADRSSRTGVRLDIAQGGGAAKLRLSCFYASHSLLFDCYFSASYL